MKDIQGYCNDCGKLFCKECMVDHTGHTTVKIEDYCERKKISEYELTAQLEEERKRMVEITTKLQGSMEYNVALFIAGREGFFREKTCINCSVDEYCACDGADILFDIDSVMRKELIDVGQGVRMTEPVKVEKRLLTGDRIFASLSHNGILAICIKESSSDWFNNERTIQFTDLYNYKQIDVKVENDSLASFYDNMLLLLTLRKPLREATVEEVFDNPIIETFKEIEETSNVNPDTDVSLLHERRKLYYYKTNRKLFSFNVDTRENIEIEVGRRVYAIASFTGIDCGLKTTFLSNDECTYTLNNDNSVSKVNKWQIDDLATFFPSTSNPKNIKEAMFKYVNYLIKDGNEIETRKLIKFDWHHSVIRVYRDIFLVYDREKKSWVLLRIIVP